MANFDHYQRGEIAARAHRLAERAQEVAAKGMMAAAQDAPALLLEFAAVTAALADQLERVTPYIEEDFL